MNENERRRVKKRERERVERGERERKLRGTKWPRWDFKYVADCLTPREGRRMSDRGLRRSLSRPGSVSKVKWGGRGEEGERRINERCW